MAFDVSANPPPTPPVPLHPSIARVDESGKPTRQVIEYETRRMQFDKNLIDWMKQIAAAIP